MAEENCLKLREIALELLKKISEEKENSEGFIVTRLRPEVNFSVFRTKDFLDEGIPAPRCLRQILLAFVLCAKDLSETQPEILPGLLVVFPHTLQHALDLVDRNCVSKVVSESGRELFQVKGNSGNNYVCLMSSEFCTCPSYTYYVLMKKEVLMCKHVLSIYIARGLQCVNERQLTDEEFAQILTA